MRFDNFWDRKTFFSATQGFGNILIILSDIYRIQSNNKVKVKVNKVNKVRIFPK